MIGRFLGLYERNKKLINNFSYLAVLQVFSLMVPLVTLPYLLVVLGKENYGLIVFSQTVVSYFLILINFGFDIVATKEISIYRDDKEKVSEIVSSVIIIKGLFFIISFIILFSLLPFFSSESLKLMLFLMMYLCFYEWIFPVWYFQGKEEMKYITIINLISRLFFLGLIFFVVKNQDDFYKVPILNGIGSFLAGIFSLWLVFIKDKVKFRFQKIKTLKLYVQESFPIFLGNIAGKIKILSNKSILGVFVGMETLAIYDIADKIKDVFIYFLQLIVPALFPNVVKNKNGNLVRKIIKIIFFSSIVIYLLVCLSVYLLIQFYFEQKYEVLYIFLFLGFLIIVQPLSYLIGVAVLLVNDLKKQYTFSLYLSVSIYLLLILGFYFFGEITVYKLSFAISFSVFSELLIRILISKKNNLSKWIF